MHRTLSACCWNSRCDNNTLSQKNWGTHVMPHNSCKCGPILIILSLPYTQINCRKRLTLVPATRGVGKNTPQCSFCKKSPSKQWNKTVIFVTLSQTLLAFRSNWVYLYIYFRFYVAGQDLASTRLVFATISNESLSNEGCKRHRCDVS